MKSLGRAAGNFVSMLTLRLVQLFIVCGATAIALGVIM
jgi:hypothetical protein